MQGFHLNSNFILKIFTVDCGPLETSECCVGCVGCVQWAVDLTVVPLETSNFKMVLNAEPSNHTTHNTQLDNRRARENKTQ